MIEAELLDLSIERQCELIELARSSYYREPRREESPLNQRVMRIIDEEFTEHPFYGTRQLRNVIRDDYGIRVNRKRVQRLMRKMGIESVAPKPKATTIPVKEHKKYPYLLRNLNINPSNQVWATDITYIRMRGGHVYLTAVMDWYSRMVLSWEVSVSMDDSFCVAALESALRHYDKPGIFNTDQGSQYTGAAFTGVLKKNGIAISMDGKGRAMDNIMVERLWRTVKYEEVFLKEYGSVFELVESLGKYFDFYNNRRPHKALGGRTPSAAYAQGFHQENVA